MELKVGRSIDFWLKVPAERRSHVRKVRLVVQDEAPPITGSLTDKANAAFRLVDDDPFWLDSAALQDAGVSSVSGVGSARGIADAYAAALGADGGRPALSAATVARLGSCTGPVTTSCSTSQPVRFGLPEAGC